MMYDRCCDKGKFEIVIRIDRIELRLECNVVGIEWNL